MYFLALTTTGSYWTIIEIFLSNRIHFTTSIIGFIELILMELVAITNIYTILAHLMSSCMMINLIICNFKINSLQYSEANQQLLKAQLYCKLHSKSKTIRSNIRIGLRGYFSRHTKSLCTTNEINEIIGRFLLSTLAIHTPINAYLVMSLINKRHNSSHALFIAINIYYQCVLIFGLHLIAMLYSTKIHGSSKSLLQINAHLKPGTISVNLRLRLLHYISKIHTKQKYGITYGTFGLVTLVSFGKV